MNKSRYGSFRKTGKHAASLFATASVLAIGLAMPVGAQTTCDGAGNCVLSNPMTPGNFNNGTGSLNVTGGTVNLTGTARYEDSVGPNIQYMRLADGYNTGYFTAIGDAVDPNSAFALNVGMQNNSIAVYDPITGGSITVNTYTTGNIQQTVAGGSLNWSRAIYFPTEAGAGPMINARIADVSGGGILNFNVAGTIGNTTTKDTIFVKVTDGVVNWDSQNTIVHARSSAGITSASLSPYNVSVDTHTYAGTFTVTLADGSVTQHTVTDITSLQAYNDWLVAQLQAGKLGTGASAQSNYNNAFAQAYIRKTNLYQVNPNPNAISPTDPLFIPVGERVAMQADGVNATGRVSTTGRLTITYGIGLHAMNGGTVINDGTIITYGNEATSGISATSGGHAINNGVRYAGPISDIRNETGWDNVSDSGSTYLNTGIINLSGWTYNTTSTQYQMALRVFNYGTITNQGTINVGTTTQTSDGYPTGVWLYSAGATLINDTAGVMYVGREQSDNISVAPIDRGGADVAQSNGGRLVNAAAGGVIIDNRGTMIIGDLVQNGIAIHASVANAMNIVNNGIIEVRGHYNATPMPNIGILSLSTAAGTVVNNAGLINLTGINVIGIKTTTGGKAQSSGTINVSGGADPSTGLRNYGIWSEGTGSQVDLSGIVNLSGDGAIGVHARASGGVAISGNGQVVFLSGTNQIGYFVYGAGSSISNTGTGSQNVSTEGSVLFRMEDGADFAGGAGASSVLTASGKDTTAVVVTGVTGTDVSAFNSGGMTLNLSGPGATGVLVEGGAQGKITSSATINLTGVGAIAGIADGQKHALDGSDVGSIVVGSLTNATLDAGASGFGTGTILVAGANLNSSLDEVTGYIARNGASLDNSGNIIFTGQDTTGIRVEEGSTGGNSGSITIQDGGVGLIAASSNAVTTLNNSGNLILKGGSTTNRTVGISATGSSVAVNMTAGTIDLQGDGAIGISAFDGATVSLTGTSSAAFSATATDQIMMLVSGVGSTITTNTSGGSLDASGTNSTLIRLQDGAVQSGVLNMTASGNGARGIWATGSHTQVTSLSGSTFNVGGVNAQAVLVEGGAEVQLKSGTVINLTGTNTIVGTVDGNEYELDGTTVIATGTGSSLVSEATLNSTVTGATGFVTQNAGILTNKGDIIFSGADSQAIRVLNGNFTNESGNVTANGVAVYVEGANATVDVQGGLVKATDGTAAIRIGQDAALNLVGSGLGVVTAGGSAHAVLVDTGAAGLVIDGAYIDMASSGAGTGNGVENRAEISGIQLTSTTRIDVMDGKGIRTAATLAQTNSGTVNVMGSGTGLAFETATGGAMSNNIDFSDSNALTINVIGANGTGISVNHTGNGDMKNGANVIVAAGGGSAVNLTGVSTFTNTGNLTSASTAAPVVDLGTTVSVTNEATGIISSATGTALAFDGQNSSLVNSGRIDGLVAMGAGNNTVVLNTGSTSGTVTSGSGTNAFTVRGNAAFTLLDGGTGANDTLTFDGSVRTLSASSITRFETMKLTNSSAITTADVISLTDTAGGIGAIDIDATSTLNLHGASGYTLNHVMTGTGVISAVMASASDAFSFGNGAGSAFAGTVQAGLGTLDLSGTNTTALTNATLRVDAGNVTTVGTGNQTIGGLTFNGGMMVFDASIPGDRVAASTITTTGVLDASGTGTVQVSVPSDFANDQPVPNTTVSLLEQDDQTALVQLVDAVGSVIGSGGALTIVDQSGAVVSNAQQIDISQGGTVVAEGTYDYRLTTGANSDGLYVSYGLTEVNLIGTGTDALILTPATGATGAATDLSARVTGSGDLLVAAGAGNVVSLSNALNDYIGITTVDVGTLKFAANNVLGETSSLDILAGGIVDTNGYSQSVGAVNTALGGQLNITAGSTLTIADSQRTSGDGGSLENNTLFGSGTFVINPSIVRVNGVQSGYTGLVQVTGGSQLMLNTAEAFNTAAGIELVTSSDKVTFGDLSSYDASWTDIPNGTTSVGFGGLGTVEFRDGSNVTLSGNSSSFSGLFDVGADTTVTATERSNVGTAGILASGTFVADTFADWTFDNVVTGSGVFAKSGSATMTVDQALAGFTGLTEVRSGILVVGDATSTSASVGGSARVLTGATLSGRGTIAGPVDNAGTIAAFNAIVGHEAEDASNFTVGALTNSGTILLAGGMVGNTLTVNNGLTSNGGSIIMNTVFGGDDSQTDRLILNGGATTGSTSLVITNKGGSGAQTNVGIQVVEAQNGATTTSDAFTLGIGSSGYRSTTGTLAIGAYDYSLVRGGNGGNADSWYLTSEMPVVAGGSGNGSGSGIPGGHRYRPEAGAYQLGHQVARTMFMMSLHDRDGYAGMSTTNREYAGWARVTAKREHGRAGSNAISTSADTFTAQVGVDLFKYESPDLGTFYAGIMGGWGTSDIDGKSRQINNAKTTGKTKGYSIGAYGTWYQNDRGQPGAYVDVWGQYSWFNHEISGYGLPKEKYDSQAATISLETGYSFLLHSSETAKIYLEPQVQLAYVSYHSGSLTETSGTQVRYRNGSGLLARAGARLYGEFLLENGAKLRPYLEANYWYNQNAGKLYMNNDLVPSGAPRSFGEVKLGISGEITKNLQVWGDIGTQFGGKHYNAVTGQVGLKYTW
ncbi:autotransporter outer membrane beta-barrel domain-containing protein [Microvirga sp. W0021]|uniref:Autotransporter outer membrane beta-barrel domain-containing protein n=1 Tax=Hohaiivirga grylli TaxID=3133970 RepID=A0ABV0BPP0_9HYPH